MGTHDIWLTRNTQKGVDIPRSKCYINRVIRLIGGTVYTGDLKSPARMGLRVRIPHQLPYKKLKEQ